MLTVRFSPRKLIVLLLFPLFHTTTSAQTRLSADVCIYGGTSAGVIAAYTASKLGKSVILVEPGSHVGGMSSGGLSNTDIGKKESITGLARDFYRRVGAYYGRPEWFHFEPKIASQVFQSYLRQSVVNVLYRSRLSSVTKTDARLTEIVVEDAAGAKKSIKASVFLDCTYEGDLMAKAGVNYALGREANKKYKEKFNGVFYVPFSQQFPDNIDPYVVPGDPSSGLLWGITADKFEPNGSGDQKLQAYNYRVCLTSYTPNQLPFTRPARYDSTHYELFLRLIRAQPSLTLNDCLAIREIPNLKADVNNNGPFSTDMIGENYQYIEADYATREKIAEKHIDYVKGFFYFLANDRRIPSALQKEMRKWGYPKDEYTDNGNWTPQLYVREGRRLIADYVVTEANCMGTATVSDGVALASYTMDSPPRSARRGSGERKAQRSKRRKCSGRRAETVFNTLSRDCPQRGRMYKSDCAGMRFRLSYCVWLGPDGAGIYATGAGGGSGGGDGHCRRQTGSTDRRRVTATGNFSWILSSMIPSSWQETVRFP
jgi:hypothetical protein